MRLRFVLTASFALLLTSLSISHAGEASERAASIERGKSALLGRSFTPPFFSRQAYDTVWKQWGLREKPAHFALRFRERYGLHPAPYANGDLPMGLRESKSLVITGPTIDCLLCHGGSILGKSYVGLPNTTIDFQAMMEEMTRAEYGNTNTRDGFQLTRVRGTTEAVALSTFLIGLRDPELKLRAASGARPLKLGLRDDLCGDAPAWWLLKKKKTMYHSGSTDTRSVRSLMQFMMHPLTVPSAFGREEATFADIRNYLLSLEAPRYPFPVDEAKAARGQEIFAQTCARCHGTYGEKSTYPNRIIPLDEIGTDPTRHHGLTQAFVDHYNAGWFGEQYPLRRTGGYQAPPLDGIWATAPYLHNGAVPTLAHLLNSKTRPTLFTRSYRTEAEDYDTTNVGWKTRPVTEKEQAQLSGMERRRVYNTREVGRSNAGHTYGDHLSEEDRRALIEYLKKL